VFLSSPAESRELQTVRLSPPTPMRFTGRWSWDAADDCSLVLALRCVWRSGCLGIDRTLPGLALDSVTRPERTFEVFRETSPTDSHCCETGHRPSLRLHFGALVHCPARLTPSSSHGVGPRKPARTGTSAPRPSIDHPLRDASREVTVRVHSRMGSKLLILRPRDANPEVTFRPRGFAPPRRLAPRAARGLVASLCRPWGSSRFLPDNRGCCAFPATCTTPRRTPPTRRGLSGHPVP